MKKTQKDFLIIIFLVIVLLALSNIGKRLSNPVNNLKSQPITAAEKESGHEIQKNNESFWNN